MGMQNPSTHPFRVTFTRFDGSGGEADMTPARAAEALRAMTETLTARSAGQMKDPRMLKAIKIRCLHGLQKTHEANT